MKRDEYLKRLDRAFTQTPPELTASVEEAFRRGEEAMKQRQKIMTALSVAAALAILCAAIALAAGAMLKPRRDNVVAARGKGEGVPTFSPVPEATPQPEQTLYFATTAGLYYHTDEHCGGMMNAMSIAEADAQAAGKKPCPVCSGKEAEAGPVPEEYGALLVYYTPQGNYYHGDALCSDMQNAGAHTLAEAVDDGKSRCPVCQPGEPDEIHMLWKVFGCGLEELYPDARYAYTLRDEQTGIREWMLCYPGDSGATYGNPVLMEDWTIREGSSIPGHVGQTVLRMSVRTNADNALTVWRCATEPLHGMLEEAEAALRNRPEMLAGIKSTPLEWLTRTVVTFDEAGEDLLAVTLWFEGQAATTTFRWVRDEDGAYRISLPEAVGEG